MSELGRTTVIDDPWSLPARTGSSYPTQFKAAVAEREKRALGDACGLSNFGVNLVVIPPGVASSLRHWHTRQDELVYVLEGELTLLTDAGERVLRAGMAAGFPAGSGDGHHLVNYTDRRAVYLEVGDRLAGDEAFYPDVDLELRLGNDGEYRFVNRSGEPY